jgi:lactoylglutathione lyase
VGIANIAVKVDNLEEARRFYTGVVGMEEAFATKDPEVTGTLACFKVNDHQYVEVSPTLKEENEDRLIRIGFETTDAPALRDYLAGKGLKVPARVEADANGNRSFVVRDPDNHAVQFVQYMPGSVHSQNFGKHLASARISDHMLHVGVWVVDPAKSDAFYKDILGFRPQWKGGRSDERFEWISLMVPDGFDWIEYMVNPNRPTPRQLGVLHHYALETMDVQSVYKTVVERGYQPPQPPAIARDGRWLLQLYDKNYTRTEMMIRKPVQTPCCSPNLDDYKKLGIFTDEGGVGKTPAGCAARYDAAKGEYSITGGGANVWAAEDAFYFIWKQMTGDVTLSADVQWVGTSAVGHRKAMLMVRQSLDPGSAYADAVSHGDGLTSLQFRGAANEQTYQVITQVDGPARLRLVRKGSRYTMYAGKPGGELKPVGPVEYVSLKDPVYVGLGVCSHVATTLETAIFSNVSLEQTSAK